MEYNMDKALRAKEVAERKFEEGYYDQAMKFAYKAKYWCPSLNFISLFIMIIDIHYCRESINNGESGWHEVLRVEESAPSSKICRNYLDLFEAVKAGKNKVVGAEGALQILSDAFGMLIDSFWTKCPWCLFSFQYGDFRVSTELVCFNCGERFRAVQLPYGYHPTEQRTRNHFRRRQDMSDDGARTAMVALEATQPNPVDESGCSKRRKKDGESSKNGRKR